MFTDFLNPTIDPEAHYEGCPAERHKHLIDLVSDAFVIGGPCHDMDLSVLDAKDENHLAVRKK